MHIRLETFEAKGCQPQSNYMCTIKEMRDDVIAFIYTERKVPEALQAFQENVFSSRKENS